MRRLSSLIVLLVLPLIMVAQTSPHGAGFEVTCTDCHSTSGWSIDLKNLTFNHGKTKFPLVGQHQAVGCRQCHTSLKFADAGTECIECHTDMHNQTLGPDCARCHTPNSWVVNNITEMHQRSRFPLVGAHIAADCFDCHVNASASLLNFAPLGVECINCHQENYNATTNPNHGSLAFSTNCTECHTTNPGWKPAVYREHDSKSFPIYSGSHNGTWSSCAECHPNPSSYGQFTCISCHDHNKSDMDKEHEGVQGYAYDSPACLACHPTGSGEGMNHSLVYPLTGAHATIAENCAACHASGYNNTPNTCAGCHMPNYNASTNPNHTAINIPTECSTCHTTDPNWKPATFPIHNNYYLLQGAHAAIANNCADCHKGNYNTTPNSCEGCHMANYNQTTNPPHAASQFPVTCADCHSQVAWSPANWDHDGQYFPIYSGKHKGEWNSCSDCHKSPGNYQDFTCTTACHPQGSTNNEHNGVAGYSYNSAACLNCHPNGSGDKMLIRIDRKE